MENNQKSVCPICQCDQVETLKTESGLLFKKCDQNHTWNIYTDDHRLESITCGVNPKCPYCKTDKVFIPQGHEAVSPKVQCECCNFVCCNEHTWEFYDSGFINEGASAPVRFTCPTCDQENIAPIHFQISRDSCCINGHVWHYHGKTKICGHSFPECSSNPDHPCKSIELLKQ